MTNVARASPQTPSESLSWSAPDRHERWVLEWNDRRLAVLDHDVEAFFRTHAKDRKVAAWFQDTAKAFEEIGEMSLAIDGARQGMDTAPSHQGLQAAEVWCRLVQQHRPGEFVNARRAAAVADAVAGLRGRIPGPEIPPERLRRRDWWSGPELFVVVDDFDLLAGHDNPLQPLLPLLPQAGDIGLHVVLARAAAGSMRLSGDPLLRRLQKLGAPDVALSCPRDEGLLLGGTKPRVLPVGRTQLCTRRGSRLVQTGFVPVDEPSPVDDDLSSDPGRVPV